MSRILFGFLTFGVLQGWADLANLDHMDARGTALAGAVTTLGNDGNAVNGNPALLSTLVRPNIGISSGFADLGFENEGIFNAGLLAVLPFGWGGLGAGVSGEFNTLIEGGKSSLLFGDYRFQLAGGLRTPIKVLQFGASLSLHALVIDPVLAEGLDVNHPLELNASAGFFSSPIPYLALGLVFSDFLGVLSPENLHGRRPPALRLGVGTRNPILLGEISLEFLPLDQTFGLALGVERWLFKNTLRLSLGARLSGYFADFVPSVGFGLRLGTFLVGYALSYPVSGVVRSGEHRFSFAASF